MESSPHAIVLILEAGGKGGEQRAIAVHGGLEPRRVWTGPCKESTGRGMCVRQMGW